MGRLLRAGGRGRRVPLEAKTADGERGLKAECFDGYFAGDFSFFDSNTPVLTRTDSEINSGSWDLGRTSLSDLESFSVRWTGYIHVPVDGTYTFYTSSSDASYVFLGDAARILRWTTPPLTTGGSTVRTVVRSERDGRHERQVDLSGLPSGTYFLRLRTAGGTQTQRLTVMQ